MSRRKTNGDFTIKVISRTSEPVGVIEVTRSPDGEIINTNSSQVIDYDPRERPWYIAAQEQEQAVWSREYRLFSDQVPGITSAHPVLDDKGNFLGVIGIDFRLGELSEFLKSLKIGNSGIAFILDKTGNVLAYPERSDILDRVNAGPRSPLQEEIKSGWIGKALNIFLENERRKFIFNHNSIRYIASFRRFPLSYGKKWNLGIVVPEEDFTGPIARTHETTLLFSFWLLIIGGFLTSALSRELTEPIKSLTFEADKIKSLNFEGEIKIKSPVTEIQRMGETMNSMKKALNAFKKYVPSGIVQSLVSTRDDARLEAQSKEITLLFTDIYDFSTITERVLPAELMDQLSLYFDEIGAIIHRHEGTIDKYIGDSVMTFWGAPVSDDDQALKACRAAMEIIEAVTRLNRKWKEQNRNPLRTRIGINTGDSLVGNFGSSDRFNYTAIGDQVNLASRLEALNKIYLSRIIVSESTMLKAKKEFVFRPLDIVAVKGRKKSVKIYQLLGRIDDERAGQNKKLSEMTVNAMEKYLAREWRQSYELFQEILGEFKDDYISEMYMIRCRELNEKPPGKNWNGVFKIEFK
jgi:adenylate cyclase